MYIGWSWNSIFLFFNATEFVGRASVLCNCSCDCGNLCVYRAHKMLGFCLQRSDDLYPTNIHLADQFNCTTALQMQLQKIHNFFEEDQVLMLTSCVARSRPVLA
jgi:hypothetical protein